MCSGKPNEPEPEQDLPAEVFLDTSIPIAAQKGRELNKKVRDVLARFRWRGASEFTKLEYGNVVLSEVTYLLRKIGELGSLEKLRYHVANVLNPRFHGKKRTWAFNLLYQNVSESESAERITRSLRLMQVVGTAFVSSMCDEVRGGIGCIWAQQNGPWKKPSKCAKKKPGCHIDVFFLENRSLFEAIKSAILATPGEQRTEQLKGFVAIVDDALKDPAILRDERTCKRFGDAIIAVHSNDYRSFFTQNLAESAVLCRALRQLLLYLKQDPKEPVEHIDLR